MSDTTRSPLQVLESIDGKMETIKNSMSTMSSKSIEVAKGDVLADLGISKIDALITKAHQKHIVHRNRESEDLKELYKALHAAQVMFKAVVKTGTTFAHGTKRAYAKTDDLVVASRLALHANDLVVSTYTEVLSESLTILVTRLYHFPSGQYRESELALLNSSDEQKRGSSITYAWRYTYSPLMGLVDSSYDDDGEVTKGNYGK